MIDILDNISGKTSVTGIFGYPVEHSMSPVMHNAAFKALGLDFVYIPFKVEPSLLGRAVKGLKALNIRGINVTIPHKEEVIQYLDDVSQEARLIGAVNTIVNDGKKLVGYNTDGAGFIRSLEEIDVSILGANVIIIGAGGAARAVAIQLALSGADRVVLVARNSAKADIIADIINRNTKAKGEVKVFGNEKDMFHNSSKNIIVNCTPVGMHPEVNQAPDFNLKEVPTGAVVCDLIYNPAETLFLNRARELGHKTISGEGMLLYQGALAFEFWTNHKAPVDIMAQALKSIS